MLFYWLSFCFKKILVKIFFNLDLFSSVDIYFFNFSFLQFFFILVTLNIFLYRSLFIYFLKGKSFIYSFLLLFLFFQKKLDDLKGFSLKGWFSYLWGFFIFITFSNLLGLFPYVYGLTTNVFIVLFLSLWGWLSIVSSRFFTNSSLFIGHFCPAGSPLALRWFLRIVEVIRVVIRPLTLTLRLVAKMTTGHILVGLLTLLVSGLLLNSSGVFFLISPLLQGYLIFEVFICFIQGKVFYMLLMNYSSEHL